MAIYENSEPEWMRFDRKVARLKAIRLRLADENKKRDKEGTPTSYELACWMGNK
jgi:hypothetical protein